MRKLTAILVAAAVLLFLTSCLFVGDLDGTYDDYCYTSDGTYDDYYTSDGIYDGYYTSDGTCIEVIPKTAQWITNDVTAVYVTLDANYTTGYEWQASISGNSIYLDSQSYSAPAYTGLVGEGGTWNAKFETTGHDGTSYVTLQYVRPWDSSDVAYTITFSVTTYYGTITSVTY